MDTAWPGISLTNCALGALVSAGIGSVWELHLVELVEQGLQD